MTETSGDGMYSDSFVVSRSRSSVGVSPAATMSLTNGSETLPSGRTGTVRLSSTFFQTEMSRTSSGPIWNSTRPGGTTALLTSGAGAGVGTAPGDDGADGAAGDAAAGVAT